jgi:plastocyanin
MRRIAYSCFMVVALAVGAVVGVRIVHDRGAIGSVHVGETHVGVDLNGFSPNAIQIPAGTTVTWTFDDGIEHNVVGDDGLASPELRHGTYAHTFTTPGTYDYHCSLHPIMQGRVIVTS